MAIAVPVLVLLAVSFILPNYLAVRYALLGDLFTQGVSVGRRARTQAAPAEAAAAAPASRGVLHLWKALSPLLFVVSVILAVAVGEMTGLVIAGVGFLNLLFGFTGWRGV